MTPRAATEVGKTPPAPRLLPALGASPLPTAGTGVPSFLGLGTETRAERDRKLQLTWAGGGKLLEKAACPL